MINDVAVRTLRRPPQVRPPVGRIDASDVGDSVVRFEHAPTNADFPTLLVAANADSEAAAPLAGIAAVGAGTYSGNDRAEELHCPRLGHSIRRATATWDPAQPH